MPVVLLLAMIVLSVGADSPCFRAPNMPGARRTFQLEPEPETTTANYTVTEPGTIVTEQNATMTLNNTTESMIETSNTTMISEAAGNMTELLDNSTTTSFDQSAYNGANNITPTDELQMTEGTQNEESTSGLTESFVSRISGSIISPMLGYSETITEIHTTLYGSITSAATMPSDFSTPMPMSSTMDSEYLYDVYTDEYVSAITPMYTSVSPTIIDDTSVQATTTTTTTIYQTDQTINYHTPTIIDDTSVQATTTTTTTTTTINETDQTINYPTPTTISGSLPEEEESTSGLPESFVSEISQSISSPTLGYSETITEIHTTLHGSITDTATMSSTFSTTIPLSSIIYSEYLYDVYTDEYVSAITPMYTSISPTIIGDTSVQATTTTTTIYQTEQTINYTTPTTIVTSLPATTFLDASVLSTATIQQTYSSIINPTSTTADTSVLPTMLVGQTEFVRRKKRR